MIIEIISDFKEAKDTIKEWLFYRRYSIKLSMAKKLADMKQAAFNKQYFVVLAPNNKLVAINNKDVKTLKRKKMLNKHLSGLQLRDTCFYYTPINKNNSMNRSEQLEAKERYLKYAKKYMR